MQQSGRGLLPDLVSLLLLERREGWRSFAVDDFVAVLILEYGMGWEGLDANAMGILRGFRERLKLSRRLPPGEQRSLCAAYFRRFPIPEDLIEQTRLILDDLRVRCATSPQRVAAETPESSWMKLALAV